MQRNFDRQVWAIQSLQLVESYEVGVYEITEFKVEEISSTQSVMVHRRKQKIGSSLYYNSCFIIGPRGARKTIYATVYC